MTLLSHSRRPAVSAVTAVLAAAALIFGSAAPAMAAPPSPPPVEKLVALGDSYAAGQGAGAPLDGCLRSTAAYPYQLDAEPKLNLLRLPACSGATIEDVTNTQLSQVNKGTTLVTITAGANDAGAGAVYAACAPDPASFACQQAAVAAFGVVTSGAIAEDLQSLITAVAERAPRARIVVTDYPIPFEVGIDPVGDGVNDLTALLNAQIAAAVGQAAAGGADVAYASVWAAFLDHQVGDAEPWLGANPNDPFTFLHPTPQGQAVYAAAVLGAL